MASFLNFVCFELHTSENVTRLSTSENYGFFCLWGCVGLVENGSCCAFPKSSIKLIIFCSLWAHRWFYLNNFASNFTVCRSCLSFNFPCRWMEELFGTDWPARVHWWDRFTEKSKWCLGASVLGVLPGTDSG